MGGRLKGAILVLCVLLAPASGMAQDPTPDEDARARELFELGDQLYSHGQYDASIDAFREAHRLSHRPLMLFNLANAQERAGYIADAIASLEAYLIDAPADEQTAVSNRLAALRERVEQAAMDTAVVPHRDPEPDTRPDPNPEVIPPDTEPGSSGSSAGGPSDPGNVIAPPRDPDLTVPTVLFSVAGAFVLAGVSLGIVALDQRSQVDARCVGAADGRHVCPADVQSLLDTDALVSAFADVSFVLAAASVALGVYSLVDALSEPNEIEVRAAILPDAAYLGVSARFH